MTGTVTGARAAPVGERVARDVVLAGLRKAFGANPVLCGVDLAVPAGSITAILGPSGSGKTTLLRLVAGFARPDAGTIAIGGSTVDGPGVHADPARRRVGYVPQEGCLFPHLDIAANIAFGLGRTRGGSSPRLPRAARRARVADLVELTGLAGLTDRYPHQLSGGQQQRVALARALAPEPSLVLLDEPFSSLDASLRTSVRVDVVGILRRAGTTTVLVTHDQAEALAIADQVAVLRDGQVAQAGTPEDVYRRPADADLARFVGEANLLPGRVAGGRARTRLGCFPLDPASASPPDGTAVVVLVRPEQLRFVAGETDGAVGGVVAQRDYHGHDSLVAVHAAGEGLPASLNVRCVDAHHLQVGTPVALVADGAVVVWPAGAPAAR